MNSSVIQIDLIKLGIRLNDSLGELCSDLQIRRYLERAGFRQTARGWAGDAAAIGKLRSEEIIAATPCEEGGNGHPFWH